jgi:hypothetical protein
MSKTTIALLTLLIIAIGILLFILYNSKPTELFPSLTQSENMQTSEADTTLSLSTETQTINPGQTATIAVLIHTSREDANTIQFELSYDPQTVTVNAITPGNFFTHPVVALQDIDPSAGRITYALRCSSNKETQCIHAASPTLATISVSINPYTPAETTALKFLPKTIIRSYTGEDILKKTQGVAFAIAKPLTTFSSSSVVASQAAK